jgi:hypothetical protein
MRQATPAITTYVTYSTLVQDAPQPAIGKAPARGGQP